MNAVSVTDILVLWIKKGKTWLQVLHGWAKEGCCDSPFLYGPLNVFYIFEALSKTRLYVFDQCFYCEQRESETFTVRFIISLFQRRVPGSVTVNSKSFPSSEKKYISLSLILKERLSSCGPMNCGVICKSVAKCNCLKVFTLHFGALLNFLCLVASQINRYKCNVRLLKHYKQEGNWAFKSKLTQAGCRAWAHHLLTFQELGSSLSNGHWDCACALDEY